MGPHGALWGPWAPYWTPIWAPPIGALQLPEKLNPSFSQGAKGSGQGKCHEKAEGGRQKTQENVTKKTEGGLQKAKENATTILKNS